MQLIPPDKWVPKGVDSLEPAAELVVRSQRNTLVIAGPGAGKTELLAQQACFLLETGSCPSPRRILAISFKRDAAKNLNERVRKRCGDRAQRFDSFTLDAFAKSIVDRFMPALPAKWRPKNGYEVMTDGMPVSDMREWLIAAGFPEGHMHIDLRGKSDVKIKQTFDLMAHGNVLPYCDPDITPTLQHWGCIWWRERLELPKGSPSLTFPMLNRLAAFLLRENEKLRVALRATYAFVFIDEFQDTTEAQYDLVRAAFHGSAASLTAVGDSKQRIMLWAGAMAEIFDVYKADFVAAPHYLLRNYRSASELVRMQHVIAKTLEDGVPAAMAANTKITATGSCVLLEFSEQEQEAEHLAGLIEHGIRVDGKKARDFCIISRQRTGDMIVPLKAALAAKGIKLRDESLLQDLLTEPVVKFLLSILRLATRTRDPEAWDIMTVEIAILFGLDESRDGNEIEQRSKQLVQSARTAIKEGYSISTLPPDLLAIIGADVFRAAYRQYGNGSFLVNNVNGLCTALKCQENEGAAPCEAVDALIGADIVPAMSIHKSKGLEFHTVIFLGLEDSQWWAFAKQPDEEKRGFFVAFSRAIERVFFTFADVREERWGRKTQGKARIDDLYTILQMAGVPIEDCRQT
jgi:superfamily I DNA/RNA helicase